MEIGIDSFAAILPDPTGKPPPAAERMADLLDEVEVADQGGLDVFRIGEHHRAEVLDSAPAIILAAARTGRSRLTSAVAVLSAANELVVGRGSFGEAYPLFGFDSRDYDELFAKKLGLFRKLGGTKPISSGKGGSVPHWKVRACIRVRISRDFRSDRRWRHAGSFARAGALASP